MHSTRRSLFRTPASSVQAAALLILTGCVAAACSSSGKDAGVTAEALTGGSACEGVQLDASRQYKPNSWTDAAVTFPAGSLTFNVPSQIPVTSGNSDGKAKLTFSNDGGTPITCVYRGHGGTTYTFVKCKQAPVPSYDEDDDDWDHADGPSDPLPSAGSSVTADSFTLHVNRGDKKAGTTVVSLHLGAPVVSDDDLCTVDACTAEGGVTHTPVAIDDHDDCTADACSPLTGTTHTMVDSAVCRGRANFNDGVLLGLGGNGRACSTCHVNSEAFQLSPANVEARYQAMTASGVDDPLFRTIDADDFRTSATPSNYSNLRQRGLVRITFDLPPNIKLLDCGSAVPCPATAQPTTETFVDVWRSTPSIINVATTGPDGQAPSWPRGPNIFGGYQLDGRVDTLQNQALGALHGHAKVTSDPATSWLNDITTYEESLVTAPEGPLTALEQQGKDIFVRACTTCHGGASGTTPSPMPSAFPAINRYIDIAAGVPRPVDGAGRWSFATASGNAGNVRTYQITFSDGFKIRKTSDDPGRALLTGFVNYAPPPGQPCNGHTPCGSPVKDDWSKFDIQPLRGVSKTAPYFHNNTAATLVDVLDQYDGFFDRVKAFDPLNGVLSTVTPGAFDRPVKKTSQDGGAERAALLAYLNKL